MIVIHTVTNLQRLTNIEHRSFIFNRNFDDVLVPVDHVSRSYNDTYYVDADTVLRCHISAHQANLLWEGYANFLAKEVYKDVSRVYVGAFMVTMNFILLFERWEVGTHEVRVTNLHDATEHIGEVLQCVKKGHLLRAYMIQEWEDENDFLV
ncbi:phenylalanine--tRNA ligase, chloroplastic/mitochondrial [Tanacetum coccineum]